MSTAGSAGNFLLWALLASSSAEARPEYAVREKRSCVACHATPWGGGPRTVLGKTYGNHGQGLGLTSTNDLFYGDLRTIAYYPLKDRDRKVKKGVQLMEAAASANVPVTSGDETRIVATFRIAPLGGAALREGYVRLHPQDSTSYFLIGRFYVPFGLLTDEHLTYTRLQTNSTINNYQVGAAFAKDATPSWHLDLVLVNDFQGTSNFSNDTTFGIVANVRFNPVDLPWFVGLSGNYQYTLIQARPEAGSAYGALSLDRISNDALKGAVLLESSYAHAWNQSGVNTGSALNPSLQQYFSAGGVTSPLFQAKNSLGNLIQVRYAPSTKWSLIYKFDYLAPDAKRLGANYTRHGIGPEFYLNSNLILTTRLELATAPQGGGQSPQDRGVLGAQSDVFAILRAWL